MTTTNQLLSSPVAARSIAEMLNITIRTVRKARQGKPVAIARVNEAVEKNSIEEVATTLKITVSSVQEEMVACGLQKPSDLYPE